MITDFEDDAHFCLKCHITVIGLQNYVNHRRSGCPKSINVVEIPKSPLPSQLLPPDESFTLKADDFFSSLELQSSSKKAPAPSTSGKTFSGILTRSKTSAAIQATTTKDSEPQQSKSGKNAWIGGHQLKELGSGDNQTRLIKAVDNLSRNASLRKLDPPEVTVYDSDHEFDDFDYEDDEFEDDVDEPGRSLTGGKWKPSSPISEWSEPPPTFTGGKWNPRRLLLSPPQNHTKGKWKPISPVPKVFDTPSPTFTGSKWTPSKARTEYGDVPPPHYTKGKWHPTVNKEENVPPPGHTKGKWKPQKAPEEEKEKSKLLTHDTKKIIEESPPFRKSNGSVQYWCGPCNRRLASKIVYERHLKSELHYKRTMHETEFDDSSHLNTNPDKETKTTIRKPVEYWSHTATEDNKDTMKNTTTSSAAKKRIRRKIYVKCEVCRSRVTSRMMGKHLISHYHCRKGDITLPEAHKMVLDNIHDIVLQSPYQCAPCKFYCNTQEYFLRHWNTDEHINTIEKYPGLIFCAYCNFTCSKSAVMLTHLISPAHEEVISVINRSVPIVIRRINLIQCGTCDVQFLYNIQMRKHCEQENHQHAHTSTNKYQNKYHCYICAGSFKSFITLQRHVSNSHNTKIYLCSICSVYFNTADEISEHRKSSSHRESVSKKNNTDKNCEYCGSIFANIPQLKQHLKTEHAESTHDCPHCGKKFLLSQDVTVHIRSKLCSVFSQNKSNKCDRCPYSSDTMSDLLFHKSLHAEPIVVNNNSVKDQLHYKCPLCEKYFSKSYLRFHIRNHTNDKPYVCVHCDARFSRKNNWKYHMKGHKGYNAPLKKSKPVEDSDKSFLCATCGANFSKITTLHKHMMIHNKKFRCPEENCFHLGRTAAELKTHILTHSSEKNFKCEHCEYRGKTKAQLKRHKTIHQQVKKYSCSHCSFTTRLSFHLKRHERVHSGLKPYACPHCDYKSNNLENLRKHVLSTNKHPGKCIYECKFCEDDQFQTNFAKDFKVHLMAVHGDVFESGTEAAGYIAGIYDSPEDEALHKDVEIAGCKIEAASHVETIMELEEAHVGTQIAETDLIGQEVVYKPQEDAEDLMRETVHPEDEGDLIEAADVQQEYYPLYVITKTPCEEKDAWSTVGSFDVEESGELVSAFSEDGDALFQEHFH